MNRKRTYPDLKTWRKENGLKQIEAAAALGLSQGYYSRLEHQSMFAGKKLGKAISEQTNVPLENVLGIA